MTKNKTISYFTSKNKSKNFYNDKKVKTTLLLNNLTGEEIPEGSEVIIISRGRTKISFNIKDVKTGVCINNVWCEQLELI
jgi:hypothetical protein